MRVTATGLVKSGGSAACSRIASGVAEVGVDVLGGTRLVAVQQRPGMGEDDRVVVYVNDAGLRCDLLGDLVSVARRRDAGPDVEELPDPSLRGEVPDHPAEERAVRVGAGDQLRVDLNRRLSGCPVGGVIVLAAKHVVVNAGLVRHSGVERQRPDLARGAAAA